MPLAGALLGFGDHLVRDLDRRAAIDIASRLSGPHKKVTVKSFPDGLITGPLGHVRQATIIASNFETEGLPLFTEPDRSTRGHLGELQLVLNNFKLAGLHVDSLMATIPSCRFDLGLAMKHAQIRLSRSGVGQGYVRVSESDLEAFILRKVKEIRRVKVQVRQGIVWVEGYGEFLVLKSDFAVIAELVPTDDGLSLSLSKPKIYFGWRPADEFSAQQLLKAMNPVVHFDKDLKLQGAVRVQRIKLEKGFLEAWGSTTIPVQRKS